MDLSPIIFVALAAAWASYLIPKVLRHHEETTGSTAVETFSSRIRVLARREPISGSKARLVPTGHTIDDVMGITHEEKRPISPAAHRAAARLAAKRRRRVLLTLLALTAVVVTVASFSLINPAYVAIPVTLVVAWLAVCRVMVRGELATWTKLTLPNLTIDTTAQEPEAPVDESIVDDETSNIPAVADEVIDEQASFWDPTPVVLPSYVTKPAAAPRASRQIEIDDTGVWTSGHREDDSLMAREADAARRTDDSAAEQARRSS